MYSSILAVIRSKSVAKVTQIIKQKPQSVKSVSSVFVKD